MTRFTLRDNKLRLVDNLVIGDANVPQELVDLLQDTIDFGLESRTAYTPDEEEWGIRFLERMGFAIKASPTERAEEEIPVSAVF